jgi:prepilin-type N-terminal cleavage/methylation domain-containing protein
MQRTARADDGVTLVEVLAVMVILGILAALSGVGLVAVQKSLAARSAHREAVTQLRNVQARSVAEDTAFCVDFGSSSTTSWRVWRVAGADQGALSAGFTCSSGSSVATYTTPSGVSFTSPSFQQRDGSFTTYVLFYARGAASGGSVNVGGSGGNYRVSVDSLTGRVSSSGA